MKRITSILSIGSGSIDEQSGCATLFEPIDFHLSWAKFDVDRTSPRSDDWLVGKEWHGNRAWNVIFPGIYMWIRFKFSLDRCDKRAQHNGTG